MEAEQIKEIIFSWNTMLSENMKKYIHYRSMRNFVLHYDEIENAREKDKICNIFSNYIEEVKANDYSFDRNGSADLAKKYMFPLAKYFRQYSRFVEGIRITSVFYFGIIGDILLYVTGLHSYVWHIPIVTSSLFLYFLFISIFKKGRIYGLFY